MKQVREGYKMTELGEIPVEWELKMFQEVMSLQRGFDLPSQHRVEGDVPIYSANGMTGTHSEAKVNGPGIVTGRSGTIGKVHYVEIDFWPLNTALYVKEMYQNDPKYLFYFLYNFGLEKYSTGTGVPTLNRNDVHKEKVTIPSDLKEQQKIAEILSTVDEQIENTEQLIEKTKELKKGLMQQLLTKGIGHTEYNHTELGEIPVEWEVKTIGDIAKLRKESFDPLIEGNKKYVALEHIESGTSRLIGYGDSDESKSIKAVFKNGDILFGKLRPYLKKYWLANFDGVCVTEILPIITNDKVNRKFVFYLLQQDRLIDYTVQNSFGTKMPRTSWGDISQFLVSVPQIQEQQKIAAILSSVDEQIENYEQEKEKYLQLKKGLMQQLLTGKMRVTV